MRHQFVQQYARIYLTNTWKHTQAARLKYMSSTIRATKNKMYEVHANLCIQLSYLQDQKSEVISL